MVRELRVEYRPRSDLPTFDTRTSLKTSREAAAFLTPMLDHEPSEVFLVIFLNTKHQLLSFHEVSRGTLDSTLVHPREVLKAALLSNAALIVLAHCVARNIMRVMCRRSLCGRGRWEPSITRIDTLTAGT